MKKNLILKTLIVTLSISFFSSFGTIESNAATQDVSLPEINAQAAITVDYQTGEIIYCKDADSKRYPASTTKLLTGLLLAENRQKSDEIEFTQSAKEQPPYSLNNSFMGNKMKIGDRMSADDVMKGLLLFSGNDTAYMIADNVAGNAQAFADLMNKKAKELGANNSNFVTANGLHNENHYTTAYDLSLITKASFENDWEKSVMQLDKADIHINGAKILLENRNLTLGENGNVGGKTGVTDAAGGCLAAVYEREGRKIIGIVLKSRQVDNLDKTKFNDMEKIMDYSFALEKSKYKFAGNEVSTAELEYKTFGFFGPKKTISVPVNLSEDITYYSNDINDSEAAISFTNTNNASAWKLLFNKDVKLTFTQRNSSEEVNGTLDITFGSIIMDNIIIYLSTVAVLIIIIVLIVMIANLRKKSRNRRNRYSGKRYY